MSNTKYIYIRETDKKLIEDFIVKINDQYDADVNFSKYLRAAGVAISKAADPNNSEFNFDDKFYEKFIKTLKMTSV